MQIKCFYPLKKKKNRIFLILIILPICLNSAELIFKLLGHLQIFWTIGNFYPNFRLKILVFIKKGNGDFFRIMILQRDHSIVMRSNPSGLETEHGPALCGQWVGNRARPCWGLTAHLVHLRTAYGVSLFCQSYV